MWRVEHGAKRLIHAFGLIVTVATCGDLSSELLLSAALPGADAHSKLSLRHMLGSQISPAHPYAPELIEQTCIVIGEQHIRVVLGIRFQILRPQERQRAARLFPNIAALRQRRLCK